MLQIIPKKMINNRIESVSVLVPASATVSISVSVISYQSVRESNNRGGEKSENFVTLLKWVAPDFDRKANKFLSKTESRCRSSPTNQ